eukprot:SAG22_NODE_20505_length_265_cov_0.626506_1_plen_47_part_01
MEEVMRADLTIRAMREENARLVARQNSLAVELDMCKETEKRLLAQAR